MISVCSIRAKYEYHNTVLTRFCGLINYEPIFVGTFDAGQLISSATVET
jgi:hypothetical protein